MSGSDGPYVFDFASTIADALIQTEYRLPFEPGGFKMFVLEHDLLPYE